MLCEIITHFYEYLLKTNCSRKNWVKLAQADLQMFTVKTSRNFFVKSHVYTIKPFYCTRPENLLIKEKAQGKSLFSWQKTNLQTFDFLFKNKNRFSPARPNLI